MRKTPVLALCAILALAAPQPALSPDQKAAHAISRLTFGARPGDLEQVRELGLDHWIDQQLHPESIPENPDLEKRLVLLDSLQMTTADMLRHYPGRQQVKAMSHGLLPLPEDPLSRAAAEIAMKRVKKAEANGDVTAQMAADTAEPAPALPENPTDRLAVLESMEPAQLATALESIPQGQRQKLANLATPQLRRKIEILTTPLQTVQRDLISGKILRAVSGNRQLEEVLTDFWYNHFNVFLDKGQDREFVTAYERDVIRPRVLGKFKDLLVATAQSPAMLFYLDNWQSAGPDAPGNSKKKRGLNENYGRELLELHTLGVDGGYTQQDVTDVARCFTGWTMRAPRQGAGFFFNPRMHDNGGKTVLGSTITPDGVNEGLQVLDMVAHSPATAHFIATKLATRFVADTPPASLVKKMQLTFLATDGDLREVMRTMLATPEFWQPSLLNAKLKSPLEFVASSLRGLHGHELKHLVLLEFRR